MQTQELQSKHDYEYGVTYEIAIASLADFEEETTYKIASFKSTAMIPSFVASYIGANFSFFAFTSQASNESVLYHPHDIRQHCDYQMCVNHTADVWVPNLHSGWIAAGSTFATFSLLFPAVYLLYAGMKVTSNFVISKENKIKKDDRIEKIANLQLRSQEDLKQCVDKKSLREIAHLLPISVLKTCNFSQLYALRKVKGLFEKIYDEKDLPPYLSNGKSRLENLKEAFSIRFKAALANPDISKFYNSDPRYLDQIIQNMPKEFLDDKEIINSLIIALLVKHPAIRDLTPDKQFLLIKLIRNEKITFDKALLKAQGITKCSQAELFIFDEEIVHEKVAISNENSLLLDTDSDSDFSSNKDIVLTFAEGKTTIIDKRKLEAESEFFSNFLSERWRNPSNLQIKFNKNAFLLAYRFATTAFETGSLRDKDIFLFVEACHIADFYHMKKALDKMAKVLNHTILNADQGDLSLLLIAADKYNVDSIIFAIDTFLAYTDYSTTALPDPFTDTEVFVKMVIYAEHYSLKRCCENSLEYCQKLFTLKYFETASYSKEKFCTALVLLAEINEVFFTEIWKCFISAFQKNPTWIKYLYDSTEENKLVRKLILELCQSPNFYHLSLANWPNGPEKSLPANMI